jgi:hypothetical protein
MTMTLRPLDRMLLAVDAARGDSDVSLFMELLYLGEMTTKTVAAGVIAAVIDDRDRQRYRQLHRLVRADGLGDWTRFYRGRRLSSLRPAHGRFSASLLNA